MGYAPLRGYDADDCLENEEEIDPWTKWTRRLPATPI